MKEARQAKLNCKAHFSHGTSPFLANGFIAAEDLCSQTNLPPLFFIQCYISRLVSLKGQASKRMAPRALGDASAMETQMKEKGYHQTPHSYL